MKRQAIATLLLAALFGAAPAGAAPAPPRKPPDAPVAGSVQALGQMTRLEKALQREDLLVAQEWYRYGDVGDFTVNSLIVYMPDDPSEEKYYGALVELKERGLLGDVLAAAQAVAGGGYREGKRSRVYFDYDEISFMIGALTTVDKFAAQVAPRELDYTEVVYATKRGSKFGFYQKGRTQTAFAWFPGLYKEFSIQDLKNFSVFLNNAMVRLKEMGAK